MKPYTAADLGPTDKPPFGSCVLCGYKFADERDRVWEDRGGFWRCIADGKCTDRATVRFEQMVVEELGVNELGVRI